ncbi:MAG: hypothetical protein IRZ08_04220 [Frankia sp.]|nr:hypothetical protein [Frankia sp.]
MRGVAAWWLGGAPGERGAAGQPQAGGFVPTVDAAVPVEGKMQQGGQNRGGVHLGGQRRAVGGQRAGSGFPRLDKFAGQERVGPRDAVPGQPIRGTKVSGLRTLRHLRSWLPPSRARDAAW